MTTLAINQTIAADPEIISAVRAGERERFGEIVDRYQRMVYAIAWSRLRHTDFADDVVQETFLQAYRHLPLLRDPAHLPGWIATIARNLAIRLSKKTKREQDTLRSVATSLPVSTPLSRHPGQDWDVRCALSEIPDKYREALVLFYIEETSVRESADMLGISEAAFKTRLHRARLTLKQQLEAKVEVELRRLQPRPDLKSEILSAIGTLPTLGKAGATTGFTAISHTTLLKLLFPLLQFGITFGLVAWINDRLVKNYRPDDGTRKRALKRNYMVGAASVATALLTIYFCSSQFGIKGTFIGLGVYMLLTGSCGFWQGTLINSTYLRAMALANLFVGMTFVVIPWLELNPMWLSESFLVWNVIAFLTRKTRPLRQDYNLLLRFYTGGLDLSPQNTVENAKLSRNAFSQFARLCGSRHLIVWHSQTAFGSRYYLPPITPNGLQAFVPVPMMLNGLSFIDISLDGTCHANFSERDRNSLGLIASTSPDFVTASSLVEQACLFAITNVSTGNMTRAVRCLEKLSDTQIFQRPPHELRSQKLMYAVAIVAGIFLLWFCLHFENLHRTMKTDSKPSFSWSRPLIEII